MSTPNASVTILCGVNMRTNARTVYIEVARSPGERPYIRLEMTPEAFAESALSHIARPATATDQEGKPW